MVKNGDFIVVEYTGKLSSGDVFDTTNEKIAKESNIYSQKTKYGPLTLCLGKGHLLKGLDEQLEGKDLGKYTIELDAEKAFGKRDSKLLQLIPTQKLKQHKINPTPGLQVNMDGMIATIKTVSGGRTILDFNHPLAGQNVIYDIEIKEIVTKNVEKVKAIMNVEMQITPFVEEKEGKIYIKGIPKEIQEIVKKRLEEFVKEIVFN